MPFINLIMSIVLTIMTPSDFYCDGSPLHATVYNNFNSKEERTSDIEELDQDSYIFLNWREYEIKVPISGYGKLSFTDRFWTWSYIKEGKLDVNHPIFKRQYPGGRIVTYFCEANIT